jgi:hypothetical protein
MTEEQIEDIADEISEEGIAANPVVPGQQTVDADGNPIDMMQMQQDQMDQEAQGQEQDAQQSDDLHQQQLQQKDELHQEKLKKAKQK